MPALVAVRINPEIKHVYECLVARGTHVKIAIVAIMRKFINLANALIRNDHIWEQKYA